MKFLEGKLLNIHVSETGDRASLSMVDASGSKVVYELHGLEQLLVTEFRQQNIIEEVKQWTSLDAHGDLLEVVNMLMGGSTQTDAKERLALAVEALVARITQGKLQMVEITAVYGAQVLASFTSLVIQRDI